MPEAEQTEDALLERRLLKNLQRLVDDFEVERRQVVLRQDETKPGEEPRRRDVFARRLHKCLRSFRDILGEMSHERFAEYVPAVAVLRDVDRVLDYGARDLTLGVTSRESLSRVKAAHKEPWTVRWIEEAFEGGDIFYDIGANVGAYSLIAARALGPALRVYAFEPSFSNYAALVENVARNDLSRQVNAFPIVLTESTTLMSFQYLGLSSGSAQHAVGTRPLAGPERTPVDPVMIQDIPGFALDHFRELFGTPQPNHVKIDVDGHEVALLAGGQRTWESADLKSLLIETEGADVREHCEAYLTNKAGLTLAERWEKPAVTYSLFRRS